MPLPEINTYTELGDLAPEPVDEALCYWCGEMDCRPDCRPWPRRSRIDPPDYPTGREARLDD